MKKNLPMLDRIEVAKPCPANWDEMKGNDQVRHCSLCRLNVYNLSDMSREEAARLVQNTEGRLCVRFYRRDDGTVLTKDCPKGLKAFRQRALKRLALVGAFVLSAVGCGRIGDQLKEDFLGSRGSATTGKVTVGAIAMPTPPPPVKATPSKVVVTKQGTTKAPKKH